MCIRLSHNAMLGDNYIQTSLTREFSSYLRMARKEMLKSLRWDVKGMTSNCSNWHEVTTKEDVFRRSFEGKPVWESMVLVPKWHSLLQPQSSERHSILVDAFKLISPGGILVAKTGAHTHTVPLVRLKSTPTCETGANVHTSQHIFKEPFGPASEENQDNTGSHVSRNSWVCS